MELNGRSVLVVEDDSEVNALVGEYAKICGFEYRSALTGQRGLEEARRRHPALVILDLMLPDVTGFEVCQQLKASDETKHIPVIMLTAMSGEECREKGRQCGAADYLTKPFDPDHLLRSIAKHAKPS